MTQQTVSKMERVQTAVEWLYEFVQMKLTNEQQIQFEGLFQQAKQMEKEQIINAWRNGDNDSMYSPKELDKQAEEYYNETYATSSPTKK